MRSLFFSILLLGCSQPIQVEKVSIETYLDMEKCWKISNVFSSFLIIHKLETQHFPFFVSYKCDLVVNGQPTGAGFTSYIKGPDFANDSGILKSAHLYTHELTSNSIDHLPKPKVTDIVFLFEGQVAELQTEQGSMNRIIKPYRMINTGLKLENLLAMSPEERLNVAKRLRAGVR